jgi:hypothetical protein
MQHCDPTTLALAALGEPIEPDEQAHLQGCEHCLADAAELIEVVTVGREAPPELPEVPEHVWTGIQSELGLLGAPDGSAAAVTTLPAPAAPADDAPDHDRPAPVVPLRGRRRGLFTVGAIAAAAGALIGGTVVWAALDNGSAPGAPAERLVAQAVLDPLSDAVAQPGEADVLDSPDGQVIRVDARALPQRDGFYEVWLIDTGVTKLVALGALPAGSVGTFTVPPGVSIEDYPVVDISLEPLDGDPGHSKESLMRGVLEA